MNERLWHRMAIALFINLLLIGLIFPVLLFYFGIDIDFWNPDIERVAEEAVSPSQRPHTILIAFLGYTLPILMALWNLGVLNELFVTGYLLRRWNDQLLRFATGLLALNFLVLLYGLLYPDEPATMDAFAQLNQQGFYLMFVFAGMVLTAIGLEMRVVFPRWFVLSVMSGGVLTSILSLLVSNTDWFLYEVNAHIFPFTMTIALVAMFLLTQRPSEDTPTTLGKVN